MTERRIAARTIVTCDRCRAEITDANRTQFTKTLTRITETRTSTRLRAIAVVGNRLGDGVPRVLQAEVHFCGPCLDDFDLLFCQGKAVGEVSKWPRT